MPHLTNLNEDPQLTGKVYYSLIDCNIYIIIFVLGPVFVGRKTGVPTPSIILGGVGIRPNHAYF